ncbi:MAG: lipid-binding SYLF domain-containing protein [Proteobacteria bacterium]|nr:lipid-binding SYLF domain-containing protein [Pseudomonadota bacterium]MBU1234041.1 lipid-binding SYLF domain-containing protein [Pseudomonadota bacterium]MBU1418001.1 lipid-binding SYLF domain-containing protein [Pseudomonadota bacterium]MBU1455948.1 lipid-binding SYLF domain-containing protein [Pseudomonadota bacterium]
MTLSRICVLSLFFLITSSINAVSASSEDYSDPQALVDESSVVFQRFKEDPNMTWFRDNVQNAKAIFIVPQMLKAGFIIGGSGGSGALLSKDMKTGDWSYPAFYTMGSVSFGLQAGGEASEIILMIMTEKGMDSMLTTSFKLGADATVAAGPVGTGVKAATTDILAFARSKGAFAGISIEGAVISPRNKWNESYYGQPTTPADIVIRHMVTNPQADKLRALVTEQGKQTTTKVTY